MIISSIAQVIYFIFSKRGREEVRALIPRVKDLTDCWQNMLYHMKAAPEPPKYDRYDYTEKAEYLALIWGTFVMIITGIVLWFPEHFVFFGADWFFDVVQVVHYYEAWLATLAIFVWHMFFVMYHPKEYPLSMVFLKGRMTEEEWHHRHPLEYERKKQKENPPEQEGDK
jgi:cytochrome b subunit of formate dehydrogenase